MTVVTETIDDIAETPEEYNLFDLDKFLEEAVQKIEAGSELSQSVSPLKGNDLSCVSTSYDVVEEGCIQNAYTKLLSDHIGDKYTLHAYRMGNAHMCCISQESGEISRYTFGTQYLYLEPNQWKTLEMTIPLLLDFMNRSGNDPTYSLREFHVVGRIYADVKTTLRGETLFLYQAAFVPANSEIQRDVFCQIALDRQALQALMAEFKEVDDRFPAIASTIPCYLQASHITASAVFACDDCTPFL